VDVDGVDVVDVDDVDVVDGVVDGVVVVAAMIEKHG
jgi:hypothetical protein